MQYNSGWVNRGSLRWVNIFKVAAWHYPGNKSLSSIKRHVTWFPLGMISGILSLLYITHLLIHHASFEWGRYLVCFGQKTFWDRLCSGTDNIKVTGKDCSCSRVGYSWVMGMISCRSATHLWHSCYSPAPYTQVCDLWAISTTFES